MLLFSMMSVCGFWCQGGFCASSFAGGVRAAAFGMFTTMVSLLPRLLPQPWLSVLTANGPGSLLLSMWCGFSEIGTFLLLGRVGKGLSLLWNPLA